MGIEVVEKQFQIWRLTLYLAHYSPKKIQGALEYLLLITAAHTFLQPRYSVQNKEQSLI